MAILRKKYLDAARKVDITTPKARADDAIAGLCEGWEHVLILTRRIKETVKIGDEISIIVLSIKGNQVRLGIEAPKHVGVHREEVYARIQLEGPSADSNDSEQKASVPVRVKKSKLP